VSALSLIVCPKCDGDGYHIHVGGPGYYDAGFGNYLPSETEIPCETCDGYGEVEGCAVCGYPECECDELEEAA
jgi:RecJ-like exonuclease